MMEKIIEKLSSLNLETVKDETVLNELKNIGKIVMAGLEIKKGHFINRTRSDKEFSLYLKENDITYIKDKSVVSEYNRASLQGESIFYGCTPVFDSADENYC